METWQRRVLVALGTLVVLLAVIAVGLVIRNALGSSGLTGQAVSGDTTSLPRATTTGADSTTSPTTRPQVSPTTASTPGATLPKLPPPPAPFVEQSVNASDLRLQPEGLGPLPFGTDAGRTLSVLSQALGSPDSDSGWLPADVETLRCPGTRARAVNWGSLTVYLSDGPTVWGPDGFDHFFAYSYELEEGFAGPEGPSLRTSEGLELGDTLSRSSAIYGETSITRNHPERGTTLEIEVPGGGYLWGVFSGSGEEDALLSLRGGLGCGQ
jgi:hypothetical protein